MAPGNNETAPISYDNLQFIKSLKELTASIDQGIIITDDAENILWVNKAFEEISGRTLAFLKGKKPNIMQGEATDKDTITEMQEAVKNEEALDTEILNYKADKTPY